MYRKQVVFGVLVVLVVATGGLLYARNRANTGQDMSSLGLGLLTPTPTPTPEPGTIAMTDVKDIVGQGATPAGAVQTLAGGLKIQDIVVGTGAEAKQGTTVSVHYTGTLADGTKFDSSLDRGQPFSFTIGQGMVIAGWEEGIPGMRVGGKRVLIIPPALAYGSRGAGSVIPPNATLTFSVELIAVK